MSTNTLLTPTVISNELLRRFKNNLPFAAGASHPYDAKFQKIGDTFTLRDPVKFTAVKSATYSAQDVTENKKLLTITTQAHTGFEFTSKDLTLTVDRFGDRYLNSASVALANAFDVDGLTLAYQSACHVQGTPGTTPATAAVILNCGASLDNASCPMDDNRSLVINPAAQAAMVDALKGLFQSSTDISKQYRKGRMGTALGFEWAMAQNIRTHTNGTHGTTVQVDVASQVGSSINIKGLTTTTGTVKAGTKVTFDGVYGVNSVSGDAYSTLKVFTVTADLTADSSGNGALKIYPAIATSGAYKTCTASPANNAAVTFTGAASAAFPVNVAYHKEAFVYGMVPLEEPRGVHFAKTATDPDTGLSIRMVSQYDIVNDKFITRCDIMYGWAANRPEFAVALCG